MIPMSVQPESPNDQTFGQYISGIRGELNEYVRARVELARTGMQEQVATQGGKFGSLFIVILLATLFLIFGLLCLALCSVGCTMTPYWALRWWDLACF